MKKVFLTRPSNYSSRVNSVLAVIHVLHLKDRIIMLQGIVAIMIAERTLPVSWYAGGTNTRESKLGLGYKRMSTMGILHHLQLFPQAAAKPIQVQVYFPAKAQWQPALTPGGPPIYRVSGSASFLCSAA